MFHLPPTAHRVAQHSPAASNEKIARQTAHRLIALAHTDAAQLRTRLAQLDREWDTERVLETNATLLILAGLLLGTLAGRLWYLLSAAVAAFLLQHALQGWCPPLPVLRALGVRTSREIEEERVQVQRLLAEKEREH